MLFMHAKHTFITSVLIIEAPGIPNTGNSSVNTCTHENPVE